MCYHQQQTIKQSKEWKWMSTSIWNIKYRRNHKVIKYQKNELKFKVFYPLQQIETLLLIFFLPWKKKLKLWEEKFYLSSLQEKIIFSRISSLWEEKFYLSEKRNFTFPACEKRNFIFARREILSFLPPKENSLKEKNYLSSLQKENF